MLSGPEGYRRGMSGGMGQIGMILRYAASFHAADDRNPDRTISGIAGAILGDHYLNSKGLLAALAACAIEEM